MINLEEETCSAFDCSFPVELQHGCIDDKGRKYGNQNCSYINLEREGVEYPIDHVNSLKQLGKS